MRKTTILILHQLGDPNFWRQSTKELEFILKDNLENINCIIHDSSIPFPNYMKDIDYDLIWLGPTFLCNRYRASNLDRIKKDYSFIKDSNAYKVALPQDDYECSGILDDLLSEWNIDCIYTCSPNNWDMIYPNSLNKIDIKLGYTHYITEALINRFKSPKKLEEREFDIVYRASQLPANFGSFGQIKYLIAKQFIDSIGNNHNLKIDISTNEKKMVLGKDWFSFIENSKLVLNAPSGSSILDPYNKIRENVEKYLRRNPKADFDEVKSACLNKVDSKYLFTMISPRVIEAALSETVMISIPSSYSNLIKPNEHYIPLNYDCSNLSEVLMKIKDHEYLMNLRKRCKEAILSEPRLRSLNLAEEIFEASSKKLANKFPIYKQELINQLIQKHSEFCNRKSKFIWKKKSFLSKSKKIVNKLFLRKLRSILQT